MKKILLITILAALCATLLSQPAGLDRLYYTYKGEKGVVLISSSKRLSYAGPSF